MAMTARARRGPKKVTPERLERWALAYLERFSASAESLKRVLMRRVERSARAHGTDREADGLLVAELIGRLERSGLVDDSRFAEGRVATLRRQGASSRGIRQRLAAKGVAKEVIQASLADAPGERRDKQERDLAVLARAGFSYETALKVIRAASSEALAALVAEEAG
jgi:regulatory protein